MKQAVIVHGFKGKPNSNWKPWLKKELEARDFRVAVPEMPHTDNPQLHEWVSELNKAILLNESDDIYLIGHSLGCITILKYLETLNSDQKIKACVFVAGFTRPFSQYTGGHDSFFDKEPKWNEIKKHCDNFIAIHSKDDSNVSYEELDLFEAKLNATTILLNNKGHFGSADGIFEVPDVRDAILETA